MENNEKPPLLRPPKYSIKEWLYGFPSDSYHGPGPLDDLQLVAFRTFELIADVRAGRPITNATYANFVEGLIVASRYFCDVPQQISELIVAASRPLSTSTTFHGGFLFEGFDETTEDGNWWLNVTGQTAHETANKFFGRLHISLLTTVVKVRMNVEQEMDTDDWKNYFNDWSHLDYEFTEGQLCECNEFIVCRSVVQRELQRAEWDENEANRLLEQMRIEEVQLKCFLRSKPWKEVEQLLSVVCVETEAEIKQDNVDSTEADRSTVNNTNAIKPPDANSTQNGKAPLKSGFLGLILDETGKTVSRPSESRNVVNLSAKQMLLMVELTKSGSTGITETMAKNLHKGTDSARRTFKSRLNGELSVLSVRIASGEWRLEEM